MTARKLYSYIGVVFGTVIVALALNWFMIPNGLLQVDCGISIILHHLFELPVA